MLVHFVTDEPGKIPAIRAMLEPQHRVVPQMLGGSDAQTGSDGVLMVDADLRKAFDARDADAFRLAAHSLKSNAQTFGASRLGLLAREFELEGMPADKSTIDELRHEYARAAAALRKLCDA